MTEPIHPRPQPVVIAGQIAGNLIGVVTGLAGLLAILGAATHWAWALGGAAALATVAAGLGKFMPAITAIGAAAQVTPLSDPRDHQLNKLKVDPETYGRHAAKVIDERIDAALSQVANTIHYVETVPPSEESLARLRQKLRDTRTDTQEIPRVTDEPVRRIPEHIVPGHRLGRHVRHDPRSLAYLVPETSTPTTAMWTRRVPVFDQGDLGSCTGNAAAGVLGTDPFFSTLPAGLLDDEGEAVSLYSAATKLDDYSGAYPPDDTGSDGLSVAKAAQKAGLISGYTHIISVAAAQTAIKTGPFCVGVNWYSSMDNPDANGLVKVSGQIRGGHEFECHGYDADADLWWFTNSWGASWGKDGTFCMSSASLARLLSEQGDATVFLPIAAPFPPQPPAPTPGPAPTPAPGDVTVSAQLAAEVTAWAKRATARKDDSREDKAVAHEWLAAQ